MNRTLRVRGDWPGRITLRKGWAMAHARPWNDHVPDASLRLDRGGAGMLAESAAWFHDHQVPAVLSPPLHGGSAIIWEEAGFSLCRTLRLMERDLSFAIGRPSLPVRVARPSELEKVIEIDDLAFEPAWQIGRLGFKDALTATTRSRLLVAEVEGAIAGFAIVGVSTVAGYLQRIGTLPAMQGRGVGSSLLVSSLDWAKRRGANTMILNTQTNNPRAERLYQTHKFEALPDPLYIYRHQT